MESKLHLFALWQSVSSHYKRLQNDGGELRGREKENYMYENFLTIYQNKENEKLWVFLLISFGKYEKENDEKSRRNHSS